jgi:type IV pilus assembly protein PilY1
VDPNDPTTWITDSTLVDLSDPVHKTDAPNGQPIVAPATGTIDGEGERWVYFGTGRFFSMADKLNTDQQSYYGVKEPYNQVGLEKQLTYDPVLVSDLLDTTDIEIGDGDVTAFRTVDEKIRTGYQGWTIRFSEAKERNLGWAVLAGDLLTFTTYMPSSEICGLEGESMVYALHYRTGTAYYESVFGLYGPDGAEKVSKQMSLGLGLTITPNIHVGRSAGSTAYIQTSTGAIERLEQANPGVLKSSPLSSLPEDWSCSEEP